MKTTREKYEAYYAWMIQSGLRPLEFREWFKLQKEKGY